MNNPQKNILLDHRITGQGPVVFFLHGFLESQVIWAPIIKELEDCFCCVQVDFPGYGTATDQDFPEHLSELAQKLDTLRQGLNIDSFSIVGHSMGVYVGLEWLKIAKAELQACIWVNGDVLSDHPKRLEERRRSISLLKRHKKAYVSMAIKGLFPPQKHEQYGPNIIQLTQNALGCKVHNLVNSVWAMSQRKSQREVFADFQGVKYLIAGLQDPLIPLEQITETSRLCGAELKTYSGGHMAWLEAPTLIIQAINLAHHQN